MPKNGQVPEKLNFFFSSKLNETSRKRVSWVHHPYTLQYSSYFLYFLLKTYEIYVFFDSHISEFAENSKRIVKNTKFWSYQLSSRFSIPPKTLFFLKRHEKFKKSGILNKKLVFVSKDHIIIKTNMYGIPPELSRSIWTKWRYLWCATAMYVKK